MQGDLISLVEMALRWIVAPVAVFVWMIYRQQQVHATDIAVLRATAQATRDAHDREMKEIRETTRIIMSKLDNIEQALRK